METISKEKELHLKLEEFDLKIKRTGSLSLGDTNSFCDIKHELYELAYEPWIDALTMKLDLKYNNNGRHWLIGDDYHLFLASKYVNAKFNLRKPNGDIIFRFTYNNSINVSVDDILHQIELLTK